MAALRPYAVIIIAVCTAITAAILTALTMVFVRRSRCKKRPSVQKDLTTSDRKIRPVFLDQYEDVINHRVQPRQVINRFKSLRDAIRILIMQCTRKPIHHDLQTIVADFERTIEANAYTDPISSFTIAQTVTLMLSPDAEVHSAAISHVLCWLIFRNITLQCDASWSLLCSEFVALAKKCPRQSLETRQNHLFEKWRVQTTWLMWPRVVPTENETLERSWPALNPAACARLSEFIHNLLSPIVDFRRGLLDDVLKTASLEALFMQSCLAPFQVSFDLQSEYRQTSKLPAADLTTGRAEGDLMHNHGLDIPTWEWEGIERKTSSQDKIKLSHEDPLAILLFPALVAYGTAEGIMVTQPAVIIEADMYYPDPYPAIPREETR